LEEAAKRDHRKLGAELDLFSVPDELGSGLPVFHPKGGVLKRVMEDYARQRHIDEGFLYVGTPHITKEGLFHTSGHLPYYADTMFPPMHMEGSDYYLKAMNCPMHNLIFSSRGRSYRELPLRLFEFGSVYRYEKSGVVHGLIRVRGLTQDDSHSYVTQEQAPEEIEHLLATEHGRPGPVQRWQTERDAIYRQIMDRGWSPARQAFRQHYDTEVLDSSLLRMPTVGFIAPTDPRWIATLRAMDTELVTDSLVYRYNPEASPDGLRGSEGTFSLCTFQYVTALALAGRLDKARVTFEKMLTYANHLGLYSEEIALTGEQIGNFPQAFTHLSLIDAAIALDRELDRHPRGAQRRRTVPLGS
jgi:hypothetical protein